MSHEMYENDSAVYAGQAAWHGLGTVVEDAPTPKEALRLSGLDWEVEKSGSLGALRQDGGISYTSDYVATVRKDTNEVLGIVSPSYEVVQNQELFNAAYELGGEVKVETAGSLRNGRQIYVLLKGETFDATGRGDEVTDYLALLNSHDTTLAFSALPTSVRIVCANTLGMALQHGSRKMYRVTHAGNIDEKLFAMREALSMYRSTGKMFRETVQELSMHSWDRHQISKFWMDAYQTLEGPVNPNPTDEHEEKSYKKAVVTLDTWAQTFDEERHLAGTGPWNAANAVTHWIQHRIPTKGRKRTDASKAARNLLGEGQKQSLRVMQMAMKAV